jgi:Spy/CpxP family protein refolding chaperone
MPNIPAEMRTAHADLIDGLKANKIDMTKMQAHYAEIDKLAQARQDEEATALNGLYALLDPTQRKMVTASVRTDQAEREAKWAARANDGGAGDAGGPGDAWKGRLERMTNELDLDAAQQKSVSALLAKAPSEGAQRTESKKRMDALLTSFEGATFDAKKQALDGSSKPHDMLDRQVQFLSQLLPILKPEQRDKLVVKMRPPASGMGRRDPGYSGFPFEEAKDDGKLQGQGRR